MKNNPPPLISVIIPVYNGEKFIDQVYNNVNNQDYPNIEIIFINNNSTDKSLEKINNLKKTDDRIYLYTESKQGAGATRNKGVLKSKGDFVTFFDVDDTYPIYKISSLFEIIDQEDSIEMVFGKIIARYNDGREYSPNYNNITPGINNPPQLAINFLNFGVGADPQTILCKKEAFISINGFEDNMQIGEDIAFVFKMATYYPIYFLPRVVSEYYRHSESTLAKYKKENPRLNYYFDQYKKFYLPYIYNNNLFKYSKKFNIIYKYCLNGLISQARMNSCSPIKQIKYLINELRYLNIYGVSFFYLPYVMILTFSNEKLYRVLKKIFSKLSSYPY